MEGDKHFLRYCLRMVSRFIEAFLFVPILMVVVVLLMQVLYPFPYRGFVSQTALETGIDQFLVISVIKAESGFNPQAVSQEGARGLMQVMPRTGEWLAGELGFEGFDERDLFIPEFNIKLGSYYLAYLIREFDGELTFALAAYNGGMQNVRQWMDNSGGRLDIDDIPFGETREFVKKVSKHYGSYKAIYGFYDMFSKIAFGRD